MSNFENGVGINFPGFINGSEIISTTSIVNNLIAGGTSFATWDDVLNSTSLKEGDYIVQGGLLYRWKAINGVSGAGNPIPHMIYQSGIPSTLATVVGNNSNLASEGWTVGPSNAGTTTTDGTSVTIAIGGTSSSISEVWNMTSLANLTKTVYIGGYLGFSVPAFGQSIIQVLRGVDYFTIARNSDIAGGAEIVVRGTTSIAFRPSEYETAVTNTDENWWDIILPPGGTTKQLRIYLNHQPWFGCAMNEIPGGSSFNALQIGCNPLGSGTRNVELSIRNLIVVEEP